MSKQCHSRHSFLLHLISRSDPENLGPAGSKLPPKQMASSSCTNFLAAGGFGRLLAFPQRENGRDLGSDFVPNTIRTDVDFSRFGGVSHAFQGWRGLRRWQGPASFHSATEWKAVGNGASSRRNGGVIAEMKDNEWKHQQPAIFDRNYTRDALEIRDKTGKVALQVANLGNTVHVAAVFHCKNDWTYMVGPIAGEGAAIELRRPGEPLTYEIPPICDYPSDLHFGSCPGIERLRQMASGPHTTYQLHFPVHLCQ